MYRFSYGVNDATWRTLMVALVMEGTIWSKHFDENNFSKIKIGTSSEEVVSLLGQPLRKDCDEGRCFWSYTRQDYDTDDFDQRWIITGPEHKVVEIRKSFFID
jgi:outer membrane protein assembly factor BamE (lipoprotein component of BamABCDE complex)